MANVQVILKEKIKGLGSEADVVAVKRGFARNFLLPRGIAYEATKGNLRHVENLKSIRAEREAKELGEAEKTASKLRKLKLKLTLATGQSGKAFGSITTIDIAKAVAESVAKVELDRHQILLDRPIKNTGSFEVPVKVHADIECTLKITVVSATDAGASTEDSGDQE